MRTAVAVELGIGHPVERDRSDQRAPAAEHPEMPVEHDQVAPVGRHVSLVGDEISVIGIAVALVCELVMLVGEPFPVIQPLLAQVGEAVALVGLQVAQIGQPLTLVGILSAGGSGDEPCLGSVLTASSGPSALGRLSTSDRRVGLKEQLDLTAPGGRDGPKRPRPSTQPQQLPPKRANLVALPSHEPPPHLGVDPRTG